LPAVVRAQDLVVLKSGGVMEIKLSKAVEQDYRLTRAQPVEFTVAGPACLRVYTRLVWHEGMKAGDDYELLVRRPNGTTRETLAANPSPTARGPDGELYARWRSFYLRVPKGKNGYRLTLGSSPADTAAVRFAFEPPPAWREAEPQTELPRLHLRRDSADLVSFLVSDSEPVQVLLVGPVRLAVEGRLNFAKGALGRKGFSLAVFENDRQLAARPFDVRRLKAGRYADRKDIFPSVSKRLSLDIPAGAHSLIVRFSSGTGASGALRFLVRNRESQ
jgi:hypothetical protein